jgi:ABC-type oligopeptide transport system ATPase subunit
MNDTASLIANPQHDYTKALIGAAPQLRNMTTEIRPVTANYS